MPKTYRALQDEVANLKNTTLDLQKQLTHSKHMCTNLTVRNAFLRQRPDLPVDRLPAYLHMTQQMGSLQAKIDELMLEYCPEDMTPEQFENWKANQRPVETP
jgi:hypothetical protein